MERVGAALAATTQAPMLQAGNLKVTGGAAPNLRVGSSVDPAVCAKRLTARFGYLDRKGRAALHGNHTHGIMSAIQRAVGKAHETAFEVTLGRITHDLEIDVIFARCTG
jgi:hypothetical protein